MYVRIKSNESIKNDPNFVGINKDNQVAIRLKDQTWHYKTHIQFQGKKPVKVLWVKEFRNGTHFFVKHPLYCSSKISDRMVEEVIE